MTFAKMHIIWVNNSQHRAYTNLWKSFAEEIMRKEESLDKYGYLDGNRYNNKTTSLKIYFEIKENPRVALHWQLLD